MYDLATVDAFYCSSPDIPYVIDLIPLPSGLAAILSDGKILLFDPLQLRSGPKRSISAPRESVVVTKAFSALDCVLATAGENGSVSLWDLRDSTNGPQLSVQVGSCGLSLTSLACESTSHSVAVGTELADNQASVLIWDTRNATAPRVCYNEIHSDDVTELNFHPTQAHILLSGSTDGLVNICDTRTADEDEVVLQAINHNSSIHHAGFLSNNELYALSHDERLAIYDVSEEHNTDSAARNFGDARQVLKCQYIANILPKTGMSGAILGAGSQDEAEFKLIHLAKTQKWDFDFGSVVRLPGSHGNEIVRGFCVFEEQQIVYTCGEDGSIKAWKPPLA